MILGYPGGTSIMTRVLIRGAHGGSSERRCDDRSRG